MRNASIEQYDATPWAVVAMGADYPDGYLLPRGATALELAYKVHSDIGDGFIRAIDCRTKRIIGKDHVLQDGDVVKIVAG